MISFIGVIIFGTIIGIGILDRASGLTVIGRYTASGMSGFWPRSPETGRRGGEDQPKPPAPAL